MDDKTNLTKSSYVECLARLADSVACNVADMRVKRCENLICESTIVTLAGQYFNTDKSFSGDVLREYAHGDMQDAHIDLVVRGKELVDVAMEVKYISHRLATRPYCDEVLADAVRLACFVTGTAPEAARILLAVGSTSDFERAIWSRRVRASGGGKLVPLSPVVIPSEVNSTFWTVDLEKENVDKGYQRWLDRFRQQVPVPLPKKLVWRMAAHSCLNVVSLGDDGVEVSIWEIRSSLDSGMFSGKSSY